MTALRTADPIDCCQDALDLAGLHACRTKGDLDRALTSRLVRWFPATDMALCLADEDPDRHRVALTIGTAGPWRRGDQVDVARWNVPPEQRFVLHYLDHELGVLLLGAPPAARLRRALTTTLTHYGVALVNLTLNHESRRATDHYCASLQALEQGIVLFQESDPETVMARLMGLATTMLRATAGALYVLDEVGKSDSPLRLSQTLGVPDALLQTFRGQDGSDWPRSWLRGHAFFAQRRCDPTLGGLE
ncbi:MAG TPA: hypothetical protein VK348_06985, partial [Planctomycetota bacterium]|nr:hypothetical protein [Planctomycetota bacterium]